MTRFKLWLCQIGYAFLCFATGCGFTLLVLSLVLQSYDTTPQVIRLESTDAKTCKELVYRWMLTYTTMPDQLELYNDSREFTGW
jgi:hypothetical protein